MTKFDFLSGTNRLRYLVGIPSVSRVVSLSRPGSVSLDMPTDSQPTHNRLTSGTEPTRQRCATSAREVLKFATVFALLVTVGIGNVWGATPKVNDYLWREQFTGTTTSNSTSFSASNATTISGAANSSKGTSMLDNSDISSLSYTASNTMLTASSGGNCNGAHIWINKNTTGYFQVENIPLYGATKIKILWNQGGDSKITASYKLDNGSWTNSKDNSSAGADIASDEIDVTGKTKIAVKFTRTSTKTNIRLDDLRVQVTSVASSGPSITTSVSSLSGVGYSTNDFSQQVQSFTVSGSSLTADVTVTAPDGFEVSKSSGSGYASSVTFTKGSGTLTAQTVYVRLASGKSAGNYSGDVTCSSTGATNKTVPLSGSVPFTVTWKTNGTTHATTYVAYATSPGTALGTLPSEPNPDTYVCTGKSFYGWYDGASYSHASTAPAIVSTTTKITSNKTYNAVFADATPANNYKQISSKDDLVAGAKYLIVGNSSSTYKALPVDKATSLTSVTPSSSVISNPAADLIWTLEGSADNKWKIKSTSNSKYIQISGGNLTFETSTSLTFSASVSSSSFKFTSSASSGNKILSYYHDKNMFNAFTKENTVYVYKQQVNYTAYSTACEACAADPTVGDASLKGAFSLGSVGVTVTGCSAGENCAWEDYGFVWGTSDNPTVANNKVQVGTSGGATAWEGTLTAEEFTPGTTYHFRAYGKNGKADGTYTYSTDQSFTPRSITFNLNGHGSSTPATQYVNNGGKATDPNYSEAVAGWTFGGWYKEAACTNAWNFASDVASGSNVELYAKWTEKPKYTVTLDAGNGSIGTAGWTNTSSSVYTKTQANGDESITLPTPSCNCSGWVFQGWSTTSKSNAASFTPDKTDGASFVPANDVTYFAVYRQSTAGGNTYNKITSAGDLTTGDYVITGMYSGTTPYKMDGSLYNEGVSLGESSASVTDGSLTESTASYVWTIIKFGSSVVFRNTSTSKFLAIVDGKFALQDEGQLFTYSVTSGAWTFTSPSGKQIIYETRYNVGDSQNREIHLYKQGSTPSGNFYSNPTCSDLSITGIANPAAGGSVTLSATSAKSGEKVYAYYTEDPAYRFNSWEISGTGASISSTSTQLTEITVGTADVTLTANFDARVMYSVTWKANGDELTGGDLGSASTSVETGEKITNLPPTPSSCETGSGKSDIFVGWCTKDWNGYKNTTGEFPTGAVLFTSTDDAPIVTDNVTYYAVWAQVDSTSYNYTLDFAISASISTATAFSNFKTGLTNASANNTYYDVDNIVLGGTVYQETGTNGQIGPRLGSGSGVGSIEMPLLSAGKVAVTSIVANVKGYGDDNTNFDLTAYFSDGTSEKKTLPSESEYITTTATDYTASYSNYKTLTKIKIESNTNKKRLYVCSITVNYKQMTKYLTTCCNTPTLAFEASSYAVLRQDLQGASTTTWAEVDVTFTTNNTTGTISVPDYDSGKSVYKLSAWESRATSGGTLCAKDHAYLEVLTQPSGSTPGTGKFHVKTTSGQTGQGTYRIAITQAATDESHGNYCETTVYGFVDVTLRDKFVDKVNGNGTINRDGHGSQLGTPTLSEFGTQVEDACHSEGRKLKGWIKETDLKAQYETGNSTRVQTVDGLCETCADGTDQTSLIVAPGANVTMSGATWYAVWAYEK